MALTTNWPAPAPGPIPLAWGVRGTEAVDELQDAVDDLLAARRIAVKPSDTSRTSTVTLADDPHLTLSVAANTQYTVNGVLHVTGNASGDLNLRWTGPAATTGLILAVGPHTGLVSGSNADGDFFPNVFAAAANSNASAYGVSATGVALSVQGWIQTTAAGSLTLQWAQNVSNGAATVLKANSHIVLEPVSS